MQTLAWLNEHIQIIRIGSSEKCCVNCKHFVQHYIKSAATDRYSPVLYGHCGHPRIKPRKAYEQCERFEPK